MKELIQRLSAIPDTYDDFLLGVINYAKKDPSHIEILNDFMRNNPDATSSDVVYFIINQADFYNFSATKEIKQVG